MAESTLDEQIAEAEVRLAKLRALAKTSRQIRRRVSSKLTVRRIETIVKIGKDGFFSDGRNLYLRLRDGNATWIVRKNRRDYGFGSYPEVGLAAAREERDKLLEAIKEGRDPIAERRDRQQAAKVKQARGMTFQQCTEAYLAAHESEWSSDEYRAQWEQSLVSIAYPVFGDDDVAEIDTPLVMKALAPVWKEKTVTATRVRARIERVLDWAATAGYRPKDSLNPARWQGHLEHQLAKPSKIATVENLAAMAIDELPKFWAKLAPDTSVGALALKFAILTACRSGEVLGARWQEFDLTARTWSIPKTRMKGRREHTVPLTDAMLDILETLRRLPASPYVFSWTERRKDGDTAARPVGPMIMRRVLAKYGHSDLTVHGFRAAFSSWAAARTPFPFEVREASLAHLVGNKTQRTYQREDLLEKRRVLMQRWAEFCTLPAPVGEVVPFTPARQSA